MNNIILIDVTAKNWEEICCLNPGKEGREFVASNSVSIAQSVFENGWKIKGIQADDILIGFTMYGFSDELEAYKQVLLYITKTESSNESLQPNYYHRRSVFTDFSGPVDK